MHMVRMECGSKCAYWIRGVFIILWIIATLFFSNLTVYADSAPGGDIANPAVRAADLAEPAVVRIITTIKGHLTVHFPPTTQITFPQQDNGSYPLQISGTGTFITSQADILTNDHVVNPPKDKTLDQMLYSAAAQDIANYINQNAKQGSSQTTKDDVIQQLNSAQLSSTTAYDSPNSIVYLSTSYTGALTGPDLKSLPTGVSWQVDQIKKESPPDQQDLAVVHVPMHDAPNVQLADSSNIHDQGSITIIGFSGNADMSQQPNDFLTLSVDTTSLGSQQTNGIATPVTLADNTLENNHHNSGLAVDSQGNIIGLISSSSGSTGTSLSQENKNEHAMINSLNLDTTPGQFQQLWNQSFQDYISTTPDHWQKAQDDFNQLELNYPNFKAAQPYVNYVQEQVQRELATPTAATPSATASVQKHQPRSKIPVAIPTSFLSALALTGGAIILLLVLIALLFAVIVRRPKKGSSATPIGQRGDPTGAVAPAGEQTRQSSESRPLSELSATQSDSPSQDVAPSSNTLVFKIWPCGHMNRPSARFCSICGEAAPTPPTDSPMHSDHS